MLILFISYYEGHILPILTSFESINMFPFVALLLLYLSMYLFQLISLPLAIRLHAASQRLNGQLAASKLSTLKAIFHGGQINIRKRVSVIRQHCSSPHAHSRGSKEHSCLDTVSVIYHHTHQHKMLLGQLFCIMKCKYGKQVMRIINDSLHTV